MDVRTQCNTTQSNALHHTTTRCNTRLYSAPHCDYTSILSSNPPSLQSSQPSEILINSMQFEILVSDSNYTGSAVCTFMNTRVHTCISTYMHRDTHTHSNHLLIISYYHSKFLSLPKCIHLHIIYTSIYTYKYTYAHAYVFTRTHAYVYTYTCSVSK